MGNEQQTTSYVLAMYDVRGKQDFIFKTNKLQEIVGASWIIRDVFKDYLFPIAREVGGKGIYSYKEATDDDATKAFTWTNFKNRLDAGYLGEVVYDGGGNFILLFKDDETFRDVTYRFTKKIMEEIGTLRILGTCVPINPENDDYKADNKKLYAEHGKNEKMESIIAPWACLPIVQVDRKTSMPLVDYTDLINSRLALFDAADKQSIQNKIEKKGINGKLSKESFAKLLKFFEELNKIEKKDEDERTDIEKIYLYNENILDEIVEKKGEDSKLAVVYIDGNSMGAKVQARNTGKNKYEECVDGLRTFSKEIQDIYVESGIKAAFGIGNQTGQIPDDPYRVIVSAGDEINFIVKAKDAFKCAKDYLDALKNYKDSSACAGISVFSSHSPYSDAYRIAEETCESGKKKMKELGMNCASLVDFHIGQGAVGVSLEEIREKDNADGIISRPWVIWNNDPDQKAGAVIDYKNNVEPVIKLFKELGRSNVKGLAGVAKEGTVALEFELNRIFAHQSEDFQTAHKKEWEELMNNPDKRRLLYDISIAYDLWFKG